MQLSKLKTSRTEVIDIIKAWLVLSLAFTFAFTGMSLLFGSFSFQQVLSADFAQFFIISLFTVGLGFLLHEIAHKFAAQKYGCKAEFRAFDQMLYLALGLAVFVGFIFAAPGAVMIAGQVTRKENGIISAVGPLTNYVLAFIFLGLVPVYPKLTFAFSLGFQINMWLGLFNMIPFGPLDGLKIFHWNKAIWGILVAIGIFFIFVF
jgi:Zn-dependent protease